MTGAVALAFLLLADPAPAQSRGETFVSDSTPPSREARSHRNLKLKLLPGVWSEARTYEATDAQEPSEASGTPSPTPEPTPEATPAATPLPEAAPLDPRLFDPDTETVSPAGPLLAGPDRDRKDPHGVPIRLGPAIAIPTGSLLLVTGTWAGIAGRTGDSGTPLFEIGAGWGAGMVGATVSTLAAIAIVNPKEASPAALAIPAIATPIAAGLGTWAVARKLEGPAEHEDEVLAAAIAGAFAGEAIFVGSVVLSRGVVGGGAWLSFVPIGAGATLGYRLARGESGRSSPLWRAPVTLTIVF